MSRRTLKWVAIVSALTVALTFPLAVLAAPPGPNGGNSALLPFGFFLEKNCADGLGILDASQCSFNLAAANGKQDVKQEGEAENEAKTWQDQYQEQENEQEAYAPATNLALQVAKSEAFTVAKSGDAKAYGHYADIYIPGLEQEAEAGVEGFMIVKNETGDANTWVHGDVYGGNANTGNYQYGEAEIEGENAEAEAEEAESKAGDGGDAVSVGGDQYGTSNAKGENEAEGEAESEGGVAVQAAVGVGVTCDNNTCCPSNQVDSVVDPNGSDECCPLNETAANIEGDTSANGGEASINGGDNNVNAGDSYAGDAGTANGGAGGASGIASNIALAKNIGDNAKAEVYNNATSGYANGGDAYGHAQNGGVTGANEVYGVMAGGEATNVLGIQINQHGDVWATSGSATNNAPATANAENNLEQWAEPWVKQWQDPVQKGAVVSKTEQEAEVEQENEQKVSTDDQRAGGSARSEVNVDLGGLLDSIFGR